MDSNLTYPPLWKRLTATIIDLYFVFMVAYLFTSILPSNVPEGTNIAIVGLAILYDPICTSFGCTFGAFLFRFRVRRVDDPTQKIRFLKAIVRYVTKLALGWISFFTVHSDEQRRAIHDLVSGSVVIENNKQT